MPAGFVHAHHQPSGPFEYSDIFHDGAGLFRRCQAGPHRQESRNVRIGRLHLAFEVKVEKHPGFFIPQILLDALLAFRGVVSPFVGIFLVAEQFADAREILFAFVEQAVEAHRREVMGGGAIRPEAERNVVAGFAHGAIAFVVVGVQRHASRGRTVRMRHRCGGIADLQRE